MSRGVVLVAGAVFLALGSLAAPRPAAADRVTTGEVVEHVATGAAFSIDLGLTIRNATRADPWAPRRPAYVELVALAPQFLITYLQTTSDDERGVELAAVTSLWILGLAIDALGTDATRAGSRIEPSTRVGIAWSLLHGCGGGCEVDDLGTELRVFVDRRVYRGAIAGGYATTGFVEAAPSGVSAQHVRHLEAGATVKLPVFALRRLRWRLVGRIGARAQFGASDDRWNGVEPAFGVSIEAAIATSRERDLYLEVGFLKIGTDDGKDAGVANAGVLSFGMSL